MNKPKAIAEYTYRHEAEFAKQKLNAEGIECMIQSDDIGGVSPALSYVRGVKLLVDEADAERAKAVLETE